jgi:hypothetical protein
VEALIVAVAMALEAEPTMASRMNDLRICFFMILPLSELGD